jgi:hypothetical protein
MARRQREPEAAREVQQREETRRVA